MPIERICKSCGVRIKVYSTLQNKCYECTKKAHKPITKKGKEASKYEYFRDHIAKPWLDKKYGHVCSVRSCGVTEYLEVDHKKTRGGHAALKYDLKNLRYLCFTHHREVTDGKPFTRRVV